MTIFIFIIIIDEDRVSINTSINGNSDPEARGGIL